eukprot:gene11481-4645_t
MKHTTLILLLFVQIFVHTYPLNTKCKNDHFTSKICSSGSLDNFLHNLNLNYYVFDSHKYALKYWMKNMEILKGKELLLIHFDGHSDLQINKYIEKDVVLNQKWEDVGSTLPVEIDSFITPMIHAGLIKRVIWIVPEHQKNYFNYHGKIKIGYDEEEQISVNSDFFMFESSTNLKLTNVTEFQLDIIQLKNGDELKHLKIDPSKTLLDFDFDYFASGSPEYFELKTKHGDEFSKVIELAELFNFRNYCFHEKSIDFFEKTFKNLTYYSTNRQSVILGTSANIFFEILYSIVEINKFQNDPKKLKYLNEGKEKLKSVWCSKKLNFEQILMKVQDLHEEDSDIADTLFTIFYSPIKFTSRDTMLFYKQKIVNFLSRVGLNDLPLVTTIAKSVKDQFTPKSQEDYIHNLIKEILFELFSIKK